MSQIILLVTKDPKSRYLIRQQWGIKGHITVNASSEAWRNIGFKQITTKQWSHINTIYIMWQNAIPYVYVELIINWLLIIRLVSSRILTMYALVKTDAHRNVRPWIYVTQSQYAKALPKQRQATSAYRQEKATECSPTHIFHNLKRDTHPLI